MAKLKKPLPKFSTEDEEATFWDKHSPLEYFDEPAFNPLRVKVIKDRPITIRLDSENREKLDKLAAEINMGPSTFARLIIQAWLEYVASIRAGREIRHS